MCHHAEQLLTRSHSRLSDEGDIDRSAYVDNESSTIIGTHIC